MVDDVSNAGAVYKEEFQVETFAGARRKRDYDDERCEAKFGIPRSVAVDGDNNVFVVDKEHHCVRKITAVHGIVSTLAGTGEEGFRDGTNDVAQFHCPRSIAITSNGDIIVADTSNHRIRKIAPDSGAVTTIAGCGEDDFLDGPVHEAAFSLPWAVAVDARDDIIVSDSGNHCIRIISAKNASTWTVAGNGERGYCDGASRKAQFADPRGCVVSLCGDIFVADRGNHCIRKIDARTRVVSTVAGLGKRGWRDGPVKEALFNDPGDITIDAHGFICVADTGNNCIRQINESTGHVVTIAGTGKCGLLNGCGRTAEFGTPVGIDVGVNGVLYVADGTNRVVRSITEKDPEVFVMVSKRELTALEKKEEEQDELRRCRICMDRPRLYMFLPCGHFACCGECAHGVLKCPLCYVAICTVQRVYEA
eukprot:GEMP01014929.1.p1 GENE.GEMP01014929.1~~GEMP01014929.1.p1  ORF type:complete len:421 (+),score=130.63 GEMP01014929.1:395-1657(+)